MPWLPIRYREFYDVPRTFVVEYSGFLYFFDCPFNESTDDYSHEYQIFELRVAGTATDLDQVWLNPRAFGILIGAVATESLVFDPTMRRAVDARVLDAFLQR